MCHISNFLAKVVDIRVQIAESCWVDQCSYAVCWSVILWQLSCVYFGLAIIFGGKSCTYVITELVLFGSKCRRSFVHQISMKCFIKNAKGCVNICKFELQYWVIPPLCIVHVGLVLNFPTMTSYWKMEIIWLTYGLRLHVNWAMTNMTYKENYALFVASKLLCMTIVAS